MKRYLPLICASILFLLPKIFTIGIRLSDSNIYFYTAYALIQGKMLYKDIFFTNFPLLPYVSVLYYFLSFKQLSLYYLTASGEVIATAWILFHIVLSRYKNLFLANTTSILYLFSFLVLSTSDHQTGVFLAAFFAVLSYYFLEKKRVVLAGIMLGLMLMTKAYFLPIALASFITVFLKQRKYFLHFLLASVITTLLILSPSLLFAREAFIHDVFIYSLTRSQGVSKMNILWFFIRHDFFLIILFFFSFVSLKRHLFFGLVCIFSLLFFIGYKDVYYLYLNFLIPFLCLAFPVLYQTIEKKFHLQKSLVITVVIIFLTVNYGIYLHSYVGLGLAKNISVLTNAIKKEKPAALYGMNDITPALAYLTHTPMLNDVIDTNENIFLKGFLNSKILTADAIKKKAMVITHGAYYPDDGVNQTIVGGIFDEQAMKKNCQLLESLPVKTEGIENRVNLFRCF